MIHVKKVEEIPDCNIAADLCILSEKALNCDILEKMLRKTGYELICEDIHLHTTKADQFAYYVKKGG